MLLAELLKGVEVKRISGSTDITIQKIEYDSRSVSANNLFVAIRGFEKDGHDFIPEAVKEGASAVVVEKSEGFLEKLKPHLRAEAVVSNSRAALSQISCRFYGYPSAKLKVIGVTGTNGKTTTTHMIKSILENAKKRVGLIGTIVHMIDQRRLPALHTTPESLDLHRLFSQILSEKIFYVVMEVSSHSLALHRVEDIDFDIGIFTNLTRDHLDFHQSFESYREAKGYLFEKLKGQSSWAVLNLDDPNCEFFYKKVKVPKLTFSLKKGNGDVFPLEFETDILGTKLRLFTPIGEERINLKVFGKLNLSNALASAACCVALGIDLSTIKKGLESFKDVPGRMERIVLGQKYNVLIDYAHTPDALQKVLEDAKEITKGDLILVFGCGGDRDKGKRPMMGKIASNLADQVIITSDNPRTEDPEAIVKQVYQGIENKKKVALFTDRKEAIKHALEKAKEKDTVIIAGKGHEDYQILGKRKIHFSDREEVERFFKKKGTKKNNPKVFYDKA